MFVIGAGRVGSALFERAKEREVPCHLVTRDAGWEQLEGRPGTPILVTVRADDLAAVVPRVPLHRRSDLVFVQNGAIRTWLQKNALQGSTRGLLFFAVAERGGPIRPGEASPFCGPHAQEAAGFLIDVGLSAISVDWAKFSSTELEKLIWNAAFGVLCERFQCDVGTVVEQHLVDLRALVTELARIGRASMGVDLPLDWLVARLCKYSLSIREWRGSVKEYPWRNGWFLAEAGRFGIPTPVHRMLLGATGHLPD